MMHHFTFGCDLILYPGILAHVYLRTRAMKDSMGAAWSWYMWLPICSILVGLALMSWDQIRHILLDHAEEGSSFEASLAMYTDEGTLSPMGHFSQMSSIWGFVFLFTGMLCFLGHQVIHSLKSSSQRVST